MGILVIWIFHIHVIVRVVIIRDRLKWSEKYEIAWNHNLQKTIKILHQSWQLLENTITITFLIWWTNQDETFDDGYNMKIMILQRSIHGATRNTYTNTVMAKKSEPLLLFHNFCPWLYLRIPWSESQLVLTTVGHCLK